MYSSGSFTCETIWVDRAFPVGPAVPDERDRCCSRRRRPRKALLRRALTGMTRIVHRLEGQGLIERKLLGDPVSESGLVKVAAGGEPGQPTLAATRGGPRLAIFHDES